jgi:hypothetical protein
MHTKRWFEDVKGEDHMEEIGTEQIILKGTLYHVRESAELSRDRMTFFYEHDDETSDSVGDYF